jgi:preprotein translocase subunit SecG
MDIEIPKISYVLTAVFLGICLVLITFICYMANNTVKRMKEKDQDNLKHLTELDISIQH